MRYRLTQKQGLQGLRFAPGTWASGLNAAPVLAWVEWRGIGKVRTWVRTRFAGLHPGRAKTARDENSMLAQGWR